MTVYTSLTKNSPPGLTPYSQQSSSGVVAAPGRSIGLLLALTYSVTMRTPYTADSKSSTTYSPLTKN